jgi:4-hydroxy-3-polyprenylbenzoate decarboxylase
MKIVIGVTGASGTLYAQRLLEKLKGKAELELIVSDAGKEVIKQENPSFISGLNKFGEVYENDNFNAPVASGSHPFDAMVIIPCSMKTLGLLSHGIASTLIVRAAEVCMKEHRKLILCPRETPLTPIHLENMEKLSRLGVIVAPLMPSFYTQPKTVNDVVDSVVDRLLDLLGLPSESSVRWGK